LKKAKRQCPHALVLICPHAPVLLCPYAPVPLNSCALMPSYLYTCIPYTLYLCNLIPSQHPRPCCMLYAACCMRYAACPPALGLILYTVCAVCLHLRPWDSGFPHISHYTVYCMLYTVCCMLYTVYCMLYVLYVVCRMPSSTSCDRGTVALRTSSNILYAV
jgi:hypothetical protein